MVAVHHVVTGCHLTVVIHRAAALDLASLLVITATISTADIVAHQGTGDGTDRRRCGAAIATTHGIAEQAADHAANQRATVVAWRFAVAAADGFD